jgi:hypothetical protein
MMDAIKGKAADANEVVDRSRKRPRELFMNSRTDRHANDSRFTR